MYTVSTQVCSRQGKCLASPGLISRIRPQSRLRGSDAEMGTLACRGEKQEAPSLAQGVPAPALLPACPRGGRGAQDTFLRFMKSTRRGRECRIRYVRKSGKLAASLKRQAAAVPFLHSRLSSATVLAPHQLRGDYSESPQAECPLHICELASQRKCCLFRSV